jgi:hypothetical protein
MQYLYSNYIQDKIAYVSVHNSPKIRIIEYGLIVKRLMMGGARQIFAEALEGEERYLARPIGERRQGWSAAGRNGFFSGGDDGTD